MVARCRTGLQLFVKTELPRVKRNDADAYVRAFWLEMMKSGLPSLKTILAEAWTHNHRLVLVSSLKIVKPLSPVLITENKTSI